MKRLKLCLFLIMPVLLFSCKKEPLDYNPLEGEWYLQAIEWNTGGVIMENPSIGDSDTYTETPSVFTQIDHNQPNDFDKDVYGGYRIGSVYFGGEFSLFQNNKCVFEVNADMIDIETDWIKSVKRLIKRVDRYEVSEKELFLKSELKQLRFVKN